MEEKEFLYNLTTGFSPSGREDYLYEEIKKAFKPYGEISIGNINNIYVKRKGSGKNKIMLMAHLDEVALIISDYSRDGFLKFKGIGIDPKTLVSQEVIIRGKEDIPGIIGIKPPHLMNEEEKDKAASFESLLIDTGLSEKKVREKISIGDTAFVKRDTAELLHNRVACKSADDKAGVVSMLSCCKHLGNKELKSNVYFVLSAQEEVGHRGAKNASYEINPDIGIAIDVTFDSGKFGANDRENKLGGGPSVCIGPNCHPKLRKMIIETAKEANIPYQVEVEPGNTGTDAWDIQITREGIPTLLISITEKYMHTSVEVIDIDDIKSTGLLLGKFIEKLDNESLEEILCF
jgi:tetrahedral aminopeptidase